MTKISYDEAEYCLSMKGHAGSAPKGEDLVCAALSMLMFTLEETVQDMRETLLPTITHTKSGVRIRCRPSGVYCIICRTIFRTVYTGCELLSRHYPEFVQTTELEGI